MDPIGRFNDAMQNFQNAFPSWAQPGRIAIGPQTQNPFGVDTFPARNVLLEELLRRVMPQQGQQMQRPLDRPGEMMGGRR